MCQNGAIIHCPGLFFGELIIMSELSGKSLTIAMNATNPNTGYVVSAFNELVQKTFSQCIFIANFHTLIFNLTLNSTKDTSSKQDKLCAECLKLHFFEGKLAAEKIGTFRPNATVSLLIIFLVLIKLNKKRCVPQINMHSQWNHLFLFSKYNMKSAKHIKNLSTIFF